MHNENKTSPAPSGVHGSRRASVALGLSVFAAAAGATAATLLEGLLFSGAIATVIMTGTAMLAKGELTRPPTPAESAPAGTGPAGTGPAGTGPLAIIARPAIPASTIRKSLCIISGGSFLTVAITVYSGGLSPFLTGLLAALLSLMLAPSVADLLGVRQAGGAASSGERAPPGDRTPPGDRRGAMPSPTGATRDMADDAPDGIDARGYWQIQSALGGPGVWGYGFQRAYNPVTGESGESLGPGLIRKSDDTIVRIDARGRPVN